MKLVKYFIGIAVIILILGFSYFILFNKDTFQGHTYNPSNPVNYPMERDRGPRDPNIKYYFYRISQQDYLKTDNLLELKVLVSNNITKENLKEIAKEIKDKYAPVAELKRLKISYYFTESELNQKSSIGNIVWNNNSWGFSFPPELPKMKWIRPSNDLEGEIMDSYKLALDSAGNPFNRTPNPEVKLEQWAKYFNTQVQEWKQLKLVETAKKYNIASEEMKKLIEKYRK